jgi:hypothetical protein
MPIPLTHEIIDHSIEKNQKNNINVVDMDWVYTGESFPFCNGDILNEYTIYDTQIHVNHLSHQSNDFGVDKTYLDFHSCDRDSNLFEEGLDLDAFPSEKSYLINKTKNTKIKYSQVKYS